VARAVRRAVQRANTEDRAQRQLTSDKPFIVTLLVVLAAVGLAFDPRLQVQFTLPKLVALYFGTAAILLMWGWRVRRSLVRPVPRVVLVPALALAAWWLASFPFAIDRHTALYGMHGRYNGLITHASMLALFLATASSGVSRDSVRRLTAWLIAALVPVAAYAVAQSAGWDVFVWPNIRPGSTIGHPVPLAAILSMALPFAVAELLTASSWRARGLTGAAALLLLLAIGETLSRGPWVGLVAGLTVMLVLAWSGGVVAGLPSIRRYVLPVVAAVAAAAVVAFSALPLDRVLQRVLMFRNLAIDPSFADRFVMYRAAVGMLRDHPVVGVGLENFGLLYPRYRPIEPEALPVDTIPTMVHNGYLQIAATSGLPGLFAYLVLIAAIVWVVWRNRPAPPANDAIMPMAFLAAIASYLVQDMSGWLELSLSAFFWSIAGSAIASASAARNVARMSPSRARRRLTILGALALATAMAAAGSRALAEWQADRLLRESEAMDVGPAWPQVDARIHDALDLVGDNPSYLDAAGILVLRRFHAAPARALYDRAAALFEQARAANPFNPYIVLNRIELDTEALMNKTIEADAAGEGERATRTVLEMDPNNATVHRVAASFRLAQGRSAEALAAIETARRLRPHQRESFVVEGDVRRALGDRAAATDAYRQAAELFERGGAEWISAEQRLVVTLVEMGRYADAVPEAHRLVQLAPTDALSKKLLEAVEASAR
jgi:O-antigen ligase